MKNQYKAILAALVVLLSVFLANTLKSLRLMTESKSQIERLDYLFVPGQPFSLAIEDSDLTNNQVLLDPLVGTLVKYGPTGQPEPYLAESWTESGDGQELKFKLRSGLKCIDGHALSPSNFAGSLFRLLKGYAKKKAALEFEKLAGWRHIESASGPRDIGIEADDASNLLTFHFASRPHDLMNLLRMPYFGFYSPSNFAENGHSLNKFNVSSCGPYALESASENEVRVHHRDDWFSTSGPKTIVFSRGEQIPTRPANRPTIIDSSLVAKSATPSGYVKVIGAPMVLVGLIIKPSSSILSRVESRRWLFQEVEKSRQALIDGIDSLSFSESLLDSEFRSPKGERVEPPVADEVKTITAFVSPNLHPDFRLRIKSLLQAAFAQHGINVTYPDLDLNDTVTNDRLFGNQLVDLRVSGVSIGSNFHASAYRMMFCSNLGVGFPDPTGEVCRLIDNFEQGRLSDGGNIENLMARRLHEDSLIVPLARMRFGWLYSDHFDTKSIMPIPNYPRFELLRVR